MKFSKVFAVLLAGAALLALLADYAGHMAPGTGADGEEAGKSAAAAPAAQPDEESLKDFVARSRTLARKFSKPEPVAENTLEAVQAGCMDVLRRAGQVAAMLDARASRGLELGINDDSVFQGTVAKGDTLAEVLENASEGSARHYINAIGKIFPIRSFREGQPYVVVTDARSGRVKRFEYEIDQSRRLVVEGGDKPLAKLEPIEYVTRLEAVEGVIDDNLFQAVADIGESPQLALRLVDLFGSEINFIRDLQEGDSFAALLEKRYREGDYKGYGRILAARFTNRGKTYEAFLFRAEGGAEYFNGKGENLRKTLLQAPLAFTRLTSRFTNSRKHPILGVSRPHLGVDYAAPTGTPVKAVGDGTVTKRGWGGGYGNQIIIKHVAGLESMYAHLSGYARGLREGQRVRQGQVIGFVGSTGLSTGPHLDFRLRQNGKFINPTRAINPRGAPVPSGKMAAFRKTMALEKAYLDGRELSGDYAVDSIVPLHVSSQKAESGKSSKAVSKTKKRKNAREGKKRRNESKKRSRR